MAHRRSARGIFLISLLFVAVVIAMFVASALALAPSSLHQVRHEARRQAAERAVQSALQYAIARVRATPRGLWRAQNSETVSGDGLIVREEDGQVVGWVREGEQWARFRLSFNHRDGGRGLDGMDNPTSPLPDFQAGISCNNLPFNLEQPVPVMTPEGSADWEAGSRFNLPAHCLLLSVEGAAGSTVLDGAGNPTGFADTPSLVRSETVLQLSHLPLQGFDSVASATGDLLFQVAAEGEIAFRARGAGQARLRTKSQLEVVDAANQPAPLRSSRGEVRTPANGNQVTANLASTVSRAQENSGDTFYQIALSSTPRARPGAVELEAGVYEVDLVDGRPVIRHYPMNYADYKAQRLAGTLAQTAPVSLDRSIRVSVENNGVVQVHFTKDATTRESGSVTDLAIVPSKGAFQEGEAPAPGPAQGPASSPALDYLGLLATRIQARVSQGTPVINGPISTYNNPIPVDVGFYDLLTNLDPSGNLNLPDGTAFAYSNGQLTNINNYGNSWDGLPGEMNYQLGALRLAQHVWMNMTPQTRSLVASVVGSPPPADFGGPTAPPDYGFSGDPQPSATPAPGSSGLAVKDLKIKLERIVDQDRDSNLLTGGVRQPAEAVTLRGKGWCWPACWTAAAAPWWRTETCNCSVTA